MHTIELKWESFYEIMDDVLDMEDEYQAFENKLREMFEREFGCEVEIERTD